MTGQWRFYLTGSVLLLLLALAGCGRSMLQTGERAAWRHQAEVTCMKSGAVKMGAGVVQIEPIEGPGMCGADFPLKVAALGGASPAIGYGDELRPPGAIRNPLDDMRYGRPVQAPPIQVQPARTQPVQGEIMRWTPGPQPVRTPSNYEPAGRPVSLSPPGSPSYDAPSQAPMQAPSRAPYPAANSAMEPDDIPDDAILPSGRGAPVRTQPAYNAPRYEPEPQRTPPALGPMRGPQTTASIMPATLQPAATLACPLVSALDRWVAEGVQPAAQKWFGSQVTTIKQISAYSCRGMVGAGSSRISEHAFGNALDIAGFVLADGRKIIVKDGWRGSPEEQGFLHDVQLQACDMFTTVLAPGYNAAHYDHIHVDLMRRASGRRPCRPDAIPGDVVAAKARAVYAAKHGGRDYTGSISGKTMRGKVATPGEDGEDDVTGSISSKDRNALKAIAGEDGDFDDDDEVTTGSISGWPRPMPPKPKSGAAAANDAIIRAEERRSKHQ
jgi:hypothetical protein